jgi:hypothetical protein
LSAGGNAACLALVVAPGRTQMMVAVEEALLLRRDQGQKYQATTGKASLSWMVRDVGLWRG